MTRHAANGHPDAIVAHRFPLVVEALANILEKAGYSAIKCADAEAACASRPGSVADIAIVAVDTGGVEALRNRRRSGGRTILLCDDLEPAPLLAAIELGVDGVILATAPVETVLACLGAVADGQQWLDPAATKIILNRVVQTPAPALTRRERDVAELVAAGKRNRTIADTLGISEGTVKMHLHNVYAKLGLESRTQLAMDVRARAA